MIVIEREVRMPLRAKEEVGKVLKKIRVSHRYTQDYVSKEIISRSYLSLVESDKFSPSLNILLELLNRLNIELDEFVFLLKDEELLEENECHPFQENTIQDYANYSEREYENLLRLLRKKYSKENPLKYKHLLISIEAHRRFKKNPNIEEIKKLVLPLSNYFKNLNNWLIYDFRLFNNNMFCFSIEEIFEMMPMILGYIKKYENFFSEKSVILNFLCNICTLLTLREQYLEVDKYTQMGMKISEESKLLYQQLFLESISYYCKFKLESDTRYLDKLNKKLSLARQLKCTEIVQFFENLN